MRKKRFRKKKSVQGGSRALKDQRRGTLGVGGLGEGPCSCVQGLEGRM